MLKSRALRISIFILTILCIVLTMYLLYSHLYKINVSLRENEHLEYIFETKVFSFTLTNDNLILTSKKGNQFDINYRKMVPENSSIEEYFKGWTILSSGINKTLLPPDTCQFIRILSIRDADGLETKDLIFICEDKID